MFLSNRIEPSLGRDQFHGKVFVPFTARSLFIPSGEPIRIIDIIQNLQPSIQLFDDTFGLLSALSDIDFGLDLVDEF